MKETRATTQRKSASSPRRGEMKAVLMREAEAVIDELLDWNEQAGQPTLTQIEEVILKLRKRMSEAMAVTVIEAQEASRPVPGPVCPQCGREMHSKGRKRNTVESRVGSLPVQRGYYYCEACRVGLFPPRSAAGGVGQALERTGGQAGGVAERAGDV
ncbi:MAG: hypothetical protein KatS3mg053_4035 [Candidatus Roseilinea sp.]|nr:MAG: hypothetical protein D6823_10920 [Chloroflexota bacterium]BCX02129.1 MAG: hypothetical protein KatS3mg053_0067 [Candidatus Roseilinea sp.]BCX02882.1 MAG: hypothetical protein KatS3mg053_0820 [Candidatus Roseilinea sp.]BCX03599.1 MAG: hypothetical protein KatS3mg053_1537 [Candidatus Roseilinea sp.]BCX04503.1 MAG: hypothetical protein KatS3mg053_2441 [Candidatus Roseilinea sp.]